MAEPIWNKFLTERDKQVFGTGGFAARAGFGKRPALVNIDVTYSFCGDKPEPILDSIKRWPNSCGEDAWVSIPKIKTLVEACRAKGVPVFYTTNEYRDDMWDAGSWLWKASRYEEEPPKVTKSNLDPFAVVAPIAPGPKDVLVKKRKPSAFQGTPFQSLLQLHNCDSLIVTGTSTSGCVRATVIDAFSNNYRVILAEDGCFDRSQASHAINLCDMNAKYADVLDSAEIVAYINALPDGLFDLPKGVTGA